MLQLCLLVPLLAGDPVPGHWRASLGPADSEVPFDLELVLKDGALSAEIQNGEEHIAVPEVVWRGSDLALGFPHYDSRITAKFADDGKSLSGEWKKRSGRDSWTTLEFRAQAGAEPCYFPAGGSPLTLSMPIEIQLGESALRGTLLVRSNSGYATATVLTPTGDLRYLAGKYDGHKLQLSGFDGSFALAFRGSGSAQ